MSNFSFLGDSYAAKTLAEAARRRGLTITKAYEADVIFISQDTKTDASGKRDMLNINLLLAQAKEYQKPLVLTSQVEPGFCRSLGLPFLYHQAETLRIEDGMQRAIFPEQIIVGDGWSGKIAPAPEYQEYLDAFDCPVHHVSWEEAEFSKLAINYFLAMQVQTTNELAKRAVLVGANWRKIANILRHDQRIGKYAYLTPGRWQDSIHLLRDYVTLNGISEL